MLLSRIGLGRNPRVWEDPLSYKPERHIVDQDSKVVLVDNDLRMISFSIGRRGCAAIMLGSTMATMLLARLVQGFSWAVPPLGPSSRVNLVESQDNLLLATPLVLHVVLRLKLDIYDMKCEFIYNQ